MGMNKYCTLHLWKFKWSFAKEVVCRAVCLLESSISRPPLYTDILTMLLSLMCKYIQYYVYSTVCVSCDKTLAHSEHASCRLYIDQELAVDYPWLHVTGKHTKSLAL